MTERWLFSGNPGVGKSTLLNRLAQRVAFPSGVSYGGGLTRDAQTRTDLERGVVYVDTAGLADCEAERAAADAITLALRTSGPCANLCFVIQLECGRVVSQDLVTMERVRGSLDSIRVRDVPFGILVNSMGAAACKTLSSNAGALRRVVTLVNSDKHKTPHVLLLPEFPALVDADKIIDLPAIVRENVEQVPTARIPRNAVAVMDVAGFQSSADLVQKTLYVQRTVATLGIDTCTMTAQDELACARPSFWKTASKAMLVVAKVSIGVVILV